MKRVGLYLRVSTLDQSTEIQQHELIAYAKARGWTQLALYEDHATGTNDLRPALRRLLRDARERRIDIVLCWKLDRLFRSLHDLLSTLEEFQSLGVEFISIKDQIDMTTPAGRLLTHLLAAFAEFEVSLIRERVRAGLRMARSKGVRLGRPKRISDEQVVALRSQGLTLSQIAKRLGVSKSGVSKTLSRTPLNKEVKNIENT